MTPLREVTCALMNIRTTRYSIEGATNEVANRPLWSARVHIVWCAGVKVGTLPWCGYETNRLCAATVNSIKGKKALLVE